MNKERFKMQHMKWIHQNISTKRVDAKFDGDEDVIGKRRAVKKHHHRHTAQKGAIKSGFNNFEFQQSQQHFYAWLILGSTFRNSKAKIKSSRDSLRLKFNAQKAGERNECWSNFQQHFFSSSRLKAGVCIREREEAAARQNS